MNKFNVNRFALSLAITAAIIHIMAVVIRLVFFPGSELMAQMFELMHPFTIWLTWASFIISLVEAIIAGYLVGLVFATVYNRLNK